MQIKTTDESLAPRRGRLPWTDFQLVLAICREQSVARASAALDMTHSTLLRKLDGIETRLRTRLFDRPRGRYSPTPAGQEIEQAALAIEPLALAAETQVLGQDMRPSGDVRVSVAGIVIDHLLPPVLVQFASAFPEVRIELSSARELVSLRRREADVAIRIADEVPDWLIGRRLAQVEFKVYGRRRSPQGVPLQALPALLTDRRWIAFEQDARDLKFDRWMARELPERCVALRVDSFSHALTMARAGLGVALLPTFIERNAPDLQALTAALPELTTPLWLITHAELRHTARVRVLMQAFGPALANSLNEAAGDDLPAG